MTPETFDRIERMSHQQDGWEVQTVMTLLRSEAAELCRLARIGKEQEGKDGQSAVE